MGQQHDRSRERRVDRAERYFRYPKYSLSLTDQRHLAGFSKSLDDQLKEVLDVVGSALKRVNSSRQSRASASVAHQTEMEQRKVDEVARRERVKRGIFHDPRLDAVSGNGIMSELGIGDERLDDVIMPPVEGEEAALEKKAKQCERERERGRGSAAITSSLEGLPIVVLRNYDAKGASKREDLLDVLANWATALIDKEVRINHIATFPRCLHTAARLLMSSWRATTAKARSGSPSRSALAPLRP